MRAVISKQEILNSSRLKFLLESLLWFIPLFIVPLLFPDPYFIHLMNLSMMMAILASSWNLLSGYSGIFSFGHQAFFGLGAYVSALLAIHTFISPMYGLLIGGITASLASLVIALLCIRLRSAPYISLATLGFAELIRIIVTNLVEITRGELGLSGIPELFLQGNRITDYYFLLALMAITILSLTALTRSPFGLAMLSIRESQETAEASGVNINSTKILVFMLSSFLAGVTGAFYAHYIGTITPSSVISISLMVKILAVTLLGGLGTIYGPILAAFILTLGLEYLRWLGSDRLLVYGLLLILIIIFVPEGIVPRIRHIITSRYL